MELVETIDRERLDNAIRSSYYPGGDDTDVYRNRLKKYRALLQGGSTKVTVYGPKRENGIYGRLKTHIRGEFSLLYGNKHIRDYIIGDKMVDIDIVNCTPSILLKEFKDNGLPTEYFIEEYCTNREEYLEKHRGLTKRDILTMIINSRPPCKSKYPDLARFHKILHRDYLKIVKEDKDFIKTMNKKDKAMKNSSILSMYIQTKETEIITDIIDYLHGEGFTVGCYMYDGLLVHSNPKLTCEVLDECCRELGFDTIKMTFKGLSSNWEPDIEEVTVEPYDKTKASQLLDSVFVSIDDNKDTVYSPEAWLEFHNYMRHYICLLRNHDGLVAYRHNPNDEYMIIKHSVLRTYLGNIMPGYAKWSLSRDITSHWLLINDDFRTVYDRCEYVVDKSLMETEEYKNVLNFHYDQKYTTVTEEYDFTRNFPLLWDYLVNVVAEGSETHAWFLLKWAGWCLSRGRTDIAIVLMGSKGCGKSFFVDTFMTNVLGHKAVYHIRDPSIDLFGTFNEHLRPAQLCGMDEAPSGSGNDWKVESQLKDIITTPNIRYHAKGRTPELGLNNMSFVFTSNDVRPRSITQDNRRYLVYKVGETRQNDRQYFADVDDEIVNNILELRGFLRTLVPARYEVRTLQSLAIKLPETEGLASLKDTSMTAEVRFGIEELHHHINANKDKRILQVDIHGLYKKYHETIGATCKIKSMNILSSILCQNGYKIYRPKNEGIRPRYIVIDNASKLRLDSDHHLELVLDAPNTRGHPNI